MKIIFEHGQPAERTSADITSVIENLKGKSEWLHAQRIDDLIDFFNAVAYTWHHDTVLQKKIGSTLTHLANFLTKEHVQHMLSFALRGRYTVLDEFVDLASDDKLYHCQPRGLALHWLSGNAPLLGFYSLVQSILTKNVSLVKPSKRAYEELLLLLQSLSFIKTKRIDGKKLLEAIAVILIDHEENEIMETISTSSDIRVGWGGEEAVNVILQLPKQYSCEDIIFGPKYSYGIVSKHDRENWKKIAGRIAFDVCTFDQYACSSPNVIYLESATQKSLQEFASELSFALDFVTKKFLPKKEKDIAKNLEILTLRTKYAMISSVLTSENLDWTVIIRHESELPTACRSRVVFVQPLRSWYDAFANNRNKQSLGVSPGVKRETKMLDQLTRKGIDRIVDFGDMTLFDSPWDGLFAVDRMVRWVTLKK